MSITNETIGDEFAKALGAPRLIVKVESSTKYWAGYDVGDEIVKVTIGDSYIAMIFNQVWNLNGFQPFIDILSKVIERLAQALR